MAAKNVILVGTYVTPEADQEIKAAAKREGIGIARWVRSAIRMKIKEGKRHGTTPESR